MSDNIPEGLSALFLRATDAFILEIVNNVW